MLSTLHWLFILRHANIPCAYTGSLSPPQKILHKQIWDTCYGVFISTYSCASCCCSSEQTIVQLSADSWVSAVHANMDKSGAWDRRTLVLNLAGIACVSEKYGAHFQLGLTDALILRCSKYSMGQWVERNELLHIMLLQTIPTHTKANTSPHSPHHEVRYSGEVQASSCRTVRGYIYPPSYHREPQRTIFIDIIIITPAVFRCWGLRTVI